ncbi:hypothetical protein HZB96_01180 [Candidatus Gottesmanbacteria bacterium]|nr:hypothetical protein [Candidatus Gottesmanbacteria bacterium]
MEVPVVLGALVAEGEATVGERVRVGEGIVGGWEEEICLPKFLPIFIPTSNAARIPSIKRKMRVPLAISVSLLAYKIFARKFHIASQTLSLIYLFLYARYVSCISCPPNLTVRLFSTIRTRLTERF